MDREGEGSILDRASTAVEAGLNRLPLPAPAVDVFYTLAHTFGRNLSIIHNEKDVDRSGTRLLDIVEILVQRILDGVGIVGASCRISSQTAGYSQEGDTNLQVISPSPSPLRSSSLSPPPSPPGPCRCLRPRRHPGPHRCPPPGLRSRPLSTKPQLPC